MHVGNAHPSDGCRCHARPHRVHERVEGSCTSERGTLVATREDGRKCERCTKPWGTSRPQVASKHGHPLQVSMGTRRGMYLIPSRSLLGTVLGNGVESRRPPSSCFPSIQARARAWVDLASDPIHHHRARAAHVRFAVGLHRSNAPSTTPRTFTTVLASRSPRRHNRESSSLPQTSQPCVSHLSDVDHNCVSRTPRGWAPVVLWSIRGNSIILLGTDRPTVSISHAVRAHVRACWASLASREP